MRTRKSVLSADQHTELRNRTYSASFKLTGYWDLYEVEPLFNVPACVLFAKQSVDRGDVSDKLPCVQWEGKLPQRDLPWAIKQRAGIRAAFATGDTPFS